MSLQSGLRSAAKKSTAATGSSAKTPQTNDTMTDGSQHPNDHANGHTVPNHEPTKEENTAKASDERVGMSIEELKQLATDFAAKIPCGQFSPAEIQGFLLKRKKFPRKALVETDAWVDGMLKHKASKTKVLQVQ